MRQTISILSAMVLGLSLSMVGVGRVEAQKNECFVACGMASQGCIAGLRGGRSECKLACRGIAPGPGRGECKRACAQLPQGPKQACKISRDRCRAECDHPNSCGFACSADGTECFTMARNDGTDCRMGCRTAAAEAAAACASALDPQACLEEVAEARGACLDQCGMDQGAALAACGMAFEACKDACHPNDPNEPDGNDPNEPDGNDPNEPANP